MRKISFRAWDEENKHMIDIARFDFADYTVYSHLFACEGYLGENLKIMQYTGLQDKHGVEIYEGDIITGKRESHWHEGYEKIKSIVVFREQAASFQIDSSKHKSLNGGGYLHTVDELEIIGNIYEHSHLLEQHHE